MNISSTEENYLKAIYHLQKDGHDQGVSTSSLSEHLQNKAASVTDMLKRLSDKKLIHYEKYKAVSLTKTGEKLATGIVRKHRLWEVFLMEKLNFGWDEVHEMAEQLEHIKSDELVERLDKFLDYPEYDPHGDPIPNAKGLLPKPRFLPLREMPVKNLCLFTAVSDHSSAFLQYLNSIGLKIGDKLRIDEKNSYDGSMQVILNKKSRLYLSEKVAANLLVEKSHE